MVVQVQVLGDNNGHPGGVSNSGLGDVPCAELTLDASADVTSFRPVQRYAAELVAFERQIPPAGQLSLSLLEQVCRGHR